MHGSLVVTRQQSWEVKLLTAIISLIIWLGAYNNPIIAWSFIFQTCSNICGPPKCQCRDGFYRNSTGGCVQGHDCGLHGLYIWHFFKEMFSVKQLEDGDLINLCYSDLSSIQRDLPSAAATSATSACGNSWCSDGSNCLLVPPPNCDSNCKNNETCKYPGPYF